MSPQHIPFLLLASTGLVSASANFDLPWKRSRVGVTVHLAVLFVLAAATAVVTFIVYPVFDR